MHNVNSHMNAVCNGKDRQVESRSSPRSLPAWLALGAMLGSVLGPACYLETEDDPAALGPGDPGGPGGPGGPGTTPVVKGPSGQTIPNSGFRRLTRRELLRTTLDLTGVDVAKDLPTIDLKRIVEGAPKDYLFDNATASQAITERYLSAVLDFGEAVAEKVVKDATLRKNIVTCTPSSETDAVCMDAFLKSFLRKALRRPLATEELTTWRTAMLQNVNGLPGKPTSGPVFMDGVKFVIRTVLAHPEYLHRLEVGTPRAELGPGVSALDDHEIASKLAYTLWGTMPDELLSRAADAGELRTNVGIATQAERMLLDKRAIDRVFEMHAMWLGFDGLEETVSKDLAAEYRAETYALIERNLKEKRPWSELLTAQETYVTKRLATLYGLTAPTISGTATAGWVSYSSREKLDQPVRGGLMSHGGMLARSGDSVTLRGLLVRARMLCTPLHLPDNILVNVDAVKDPKFGKCKLDRLKVHSSNAACAGCHEYMDPIGFGLARFNGQGAYQTAESGEPSCALPEKGTLVDGATRVDFVGPGQLGTALAEPTRTPSCMVKQFSSFFMAHAMSGVSDEAFEKELTSAFLAQGGRLDRLLVHYAQSDAFRFRLERPQAQEQQGEKQ
jgi:hypothetical protein